MRCIALLHAKIELGALMYGDFDDSIPKKARMAALRLLFDDIFSLL